MMMDNASPKLNLVGEWPMASDYAAHLRPDTRP